MALALEDVKNHEEDEKNDGRAHQKCLDLLTGECKFPPCTDYLLKECTSADNTATVG